MSGRLHALTFVVALLAFACALPGVTTRSRQENMRTDAGTTPQEPSVRDDASQAMIDAGGSTEEQPAPRDAGSSEPNHDQVDACAAIKCETGLRCIPGASSCSATCRDTGCKPGDVCQSDDDCRSSGDSSAMCSPSAHKCIGACNQSFDGSPMDDRIFYCSEVRGGADVTLRVTEPCPSTWLPYLTHIDGRFTLRGSVPDPTPELPNRVRSARCGAISFDKLESVGKTLDVGFGSAPQIRFPKLVRVGAFWLSGQQVDEVDVLSLPELTTVDGKFSLDSVVGLAKIDFPKLKAVQSASVWLMCQLPYSQVMPLALLVPEAEPNKFSQIGCCVPKDNEAIDCAGCFCQCACQ